MYGLLGVGGVRLAVPLDVLREVVPWPEQVVPLPAAAPGLLGAVDVRGDVVPLLDLGPSVGREALQGNGSRVVAILVHDDGLLGLAVDEVCGVADVPDAALQLAEPAGQVLRAAFEHPEDGAITSVLDVAALVRGTGVPLLHGRSRASTAADEGTGDDAGVDAGVDTGDDADGPARDVRPLIRLRCGSYELCVPAVEVDAVLPALRPRPSAMDGPLCRGVTVHRDVEIAVADLAALLGLGREEDVAGSPGIVLRLERGLVALSVSQVIDIEPLDVAGRLPVPHGTLGEPDRYRGLLPHPTHGQVLLLDTASLLADPDLQGMAALNRAAGPTNGTTNGTGDATAAAGTQDDDAPARGDVRPDGRAYLTYAVGPRGAESEAATLLEQVGEIVAFPAGRAVTGAGTGDVLGVFVHRGRPVSLICLSTLVGNGPPGARGLQVLLVEADGAAYGFVVSGLRAIEQATWSETPGPDDAGAGLQRAPAVKVTSGAGTARLLPALDLVELARAVRGPIEGPVDAAVPRQGGASALEADELGPFAGVGD